METAMYVPESYFLFPSAVHVARQPTEIQTVLGSCVAVCLYDRIRKSGGMNHYMLPIWKGEGLASPRFGNISIEKLIERMIGDGSDRKNLVAKIFGGAEQYIDSSVYEIGKRNIEIAWDILSEHNIAIASSSTGGNRGRKILFHSGSGQVLMKFLSSINEGLAPETQRKFNSVL